MREYRELRRHVEELVGRINGRFTDPGGDVPIYYLYGGVPSERLQEIIQKTTRLPGGFSVHPKIARQLDAHPKDLNAASLLTGH